MKLSLASEWRLTFLSLFLIITGACTVKTLYNQLDWILADHLESYVELDNEQQKYLYARLDVFFTWHRSTQLPIYVDWLNDFRKDVLSQASASTINDNFEQFKLFLRELRTRGANEAYKIIPGLSEQQRQTLYMSMEKKNDEFADKFIHISREEQLEQYSDRTENRIEEWLGSITSEQEKLIQKSVIRIQPVAKEVLKSRRKWQKAFRSLLETKTDKELHLGLRDLFVNIEKRRSQTYTKLSKQNQLNFSRLIADISKTLTPGQKQYLISKVDNYSLHFTEMAQEAKASLSK